MNFQQVMSQPGQYIQLQATITEIRHMHGEFGDYALGKAKDSQGQTCSVMFTCKKEMRFPTGLAAGHRCNWAGRYDANTQKMKLFFDSMAQNDVAAQAPVPQPPMSAPPQAQQSRQDLERLSIERQCVSKGVCEVWARRSNWELKDALFACVALHKWVETGELPSAQLTLSAPAPSDDIPF